MIHTHCFLRATIAGVFLCLLMGGSALAAFDVYPTPQTNPLNVAATSSSALVPFTELVGAGTGPGGFFDGMYIRLVMLGGSCAPSAAPDPTVTLIAGGGTPVALTSVFQGIFTPSDEVANARIVAETNDVFLVELAVLIPGSSWEIEITNNDASARDFTWVVADDEPDASQPWIHVQDILDLDSVLAGLTLTGQTSDPATVEVANLGTGDLTISDAAGVIGATDFELTSVPGAISPNACDNLQIVFNGPAAAGQRNGTYTVGSNDTTGISGATHNQQIALSASSGQLEVMLLLDTSGSMAFMPDGSSAVADPNEARWGRLKGAAKQFLDLLGTMGAGQGRFGIAMFPDITGFPGVCPAPVPSAADFVTARDITLVETDAAKTALDGHTPELSCPATPTVLGTGGTPMGMGIGRVMGTTTTGFGYFDDDSAAVSFNERFMVLMSDGANNSRPPDPEHFYDGTHPSFVDKEIEVLAIAYGDPAMTTFEVNHALLNDLATQSLGQFFDAGTDDAGLSLKKDFRSAITASLALDTTTAPGGVIAAGSEVRRTVTVTPYDSTVAFIVNWGTFAANRLGVSVLTPGCELITPESAAVDPDIVFAGHPTYKMFVFNDDYLSNADDSDNPRYGEWTLIISGPPSIEPAASDSEIYDYEVLTKSRLRLTLATDQASHYAGDPIKLTARLSLDGLGIPGAATAVEISSPGQAASNFLAFNAVTREQFAVAEAAADSQDTTSLGVKAGALKAKGLKFQGLEQVTTVQMDDETGQGIYTATIAGTSVPGTYELYVTATGQTVDGVDFRREKRLDVRVGVRPTPEFTLVDVQYRQIVEGEQTFQVADVRFWPRDRFGNAFLTDPAIDSGIDLTVKNGELIGAIDDHLVDGSYSRSIRYSADAEPVIGFTIGGESLIPSLDLVPVQDLDFVDRVLGFELGGEAEPGANQHRTPEAALGDVAQKPTDQFVSLGAYGALDIGVARRTVVARGDDDVTVFVRGDQDQRSYVVEARDVCRPERWVELGRSDGVTQSFSLGQAGLDSASAIRVRDTSGRTRDADLAAIDTPGVSLRGVGFVHTRKDCAFKRFFKCLFK